MSKAEEPLIRTHAYAKKVGATKKVVGDWAWQSPRYNQKKGTGRYVQFRGARKGEKLKVWDSKKGIVELD